MNKTSIFDSAQSSQWGNGRPYMQVKQFIVEFKDREEIVTADDVEIRDSIAIFKDELGKAVYLLKAFNWSFITSRYMMIETSKIHDSPVRTIRFEEDQ